MYYMKYDIHKKKKVHIFNIKIVIKLSFFNYLMKYVVLLIWFGLL